MPRGVRAKQTSPIEKHHRAAWRIFIGVAIIALVLQSGFWLFFRTACLQESMMLQNDAEALLSTPFVLNTPASLEVEIQSPEMRDNWIHLKVSLVSETGAETRYRTIQLRDFTLGDGFFGKAPRMFSLLFANVPSGKWRLMVEPIAASRDDVQVLFAVQKYILSWERLLASLALLALLPLSVSARYVWFEIKRGGIKNQKRKPEALRCLTHHESLNP